MRKFMKSLAVLTATLLAFASCQQEKIDPVESGVSHTLKFVASAPETKTSFEVEGAVVNYSWSETDATDHSTGDTKRPEKFQVFENGVAATSINAELTDGEMWIEATFEGQRPQQAEYRALFNAGVKSQQSSIDESYDQDSDVLVSNVLKNVDLAVEHLVFSFRREVAFGAVTLKGLDEGDYLLNVKIESDKPLAGDYDLVNESWKNTSTTLSIDSFNDIDGGEATLYFLTLPVESATLKMTVQTTDDLDNVKATYVKEFTKTISFSQGDVRPFNVTLEKSGPTPKPLYKKITTVSEIEDGTYVICAALNSDKNKLYYLENTKKAQPSFIAFDGEHISIASDNSTIDVVDATNATWTIEEVDGGFSITSTAGNYALATTTGNDGLTTQTDYVGKPWTIESNNTYNWSFKYNATSRYLCLYTLANPRTYTSNTTNANGVFFLYKLDDPRETLATPANLATEDMVLSWDAVEHAGSYEVTVGSADAVTVATNSYTFDGVADYYSVSVVAMPENTEKYKTSKPATATDLKFGTPTLVTPTLAEGTVTENSITVTWSVDKRATAGYDCDIYDGETKLDKSKNVSTGSVSFTGLEDGKTYTVKVQAKAVTGTKAYVASEVASVSVATKAAAHIGDITSEGTYTVMNVTVMAVVNTSSFIAGDKTGAILVYKGSHGCAVGNIVDIAGNVTTYEAVLEYNAPTISNKRTGSAPVYPTPVEANSDFVNGYSSNAITAYVHGVGTLNNSAKTITIGTKVISLVAVPTPAVADGEVEFTGYVYGVKNGNIKACTLTCQTYVDPTAPTLSINPDPATKTWASDATDKYTVNVTTTNGGWTISPATLTWATVVENHTANTIEITPNGANTTAADYTATITVKHAVNPSLTKTITLTQLKAGAAPKVYAYTFNSKSWGAKVSIDGGTETTANWTGTADGNQFNSSNSPLGVQVTIGAGSGATVTSPISFTNVTKVEVVYASSSKGVGTIAISVGGVAAGSAQSISKSQTQTTLTFTPGSTKNGTVVLTPTVTTNSMGIRKVIVYAD